MEVVEGLKMITAAKEKQGAERGRREGGRREGGGRRPGHESR